MELTLKVSMLVYLGLVSYKGLYSMFRLYIYIMYNPHIHIGVYACRLYRIKVHWQG